MNRLYTKNQQLMVLFAVLLLVSCGDKAKTNHEDSHQEMTSETVKEAMLTAQQFNALDMKIDSIQKRNLQGYITANGRLEVPPQNEAVVTSVFGANVSKILVIEGEQVKVGQVLAFISHPSLIQKQTDYLNAFHRYDLHKKEFVRQKKLYQAGVGSGETYQRAESALNNSQSSMLGLQSQLRLLHLNPERIEQGHIAQRIPVISPIDGAIHKVNVKTAQFVEAQYPMFEVVNVEHVHADLLVYEKDAAKVKQGQQVMFSIASAPTEELEARIISVGKTFESDPKAIHVHAEIAPKPEGLIPGMYVQGRIIVDSTMTIALPESAVAKQGDAFVVFTAEREGEDWSFKPVEVIPGITTGSWTKLEFLSPIEPKTKFAYNNAYYLVAQMSKGEGGHHH
ncbi:efflux RND transporter periplasmic adaptor subunit [Galbibacter sp.]|uniref:efflux RND transporter periplasmic adaptor subunit n=1 Tax=Galbibacter sp. TaxID=2918471 RepID=UPI003A9252BA